MRTTFAEGRQHHGRIIHFEDGKHVRNTYAKGHARHGKIDHFEDGMHVRTTFAGRVPPADVELLPHVACGEM